MAVGLAETDNLGVSGRSGLVFVYTDADRRTAWLRVHHPGVTLEDVAAVGETVREETGLLPDTLPERVNHKRVARLMRLAGLAGISRRKGFKTTVRDEQARPAPDLVERRFVAARPNQLWVADITYIRTLAGFLFLAVVLDVFSRRIVGWAMATHLRTELILDALDMALEQRRPRDVVHHSDQGSQYTLLAFGARCKAAGVRPSMGSVGDCFDNAMCESFFATLECELLARRRFTTPTEARMAVFEFIEGWYNPHRRHSALGYLAPINYERRMAIEAEPQSTPQAA
jgi:putative transposase